MVAGEGCGCFGDQERGGRRFGVGEAGKWCSAVGFPAEFELPGFCLFSVCFEIDTVECEMRGGDGSRRSVGMEDIHEVGEEAIR